MGQCKKDVTQLWVHLSYEFIALTHQYDPASIYKNKPYSFWVTGTGVWFSPGLYSLSSRGLDSLAPGRL